MKVTFPRIGNTHIAVRLMMKSLDVDTVVPEKNNADIFEKGRKVSPEEICLPFKMMAGNLIDGVERGANTVLMISSMGPCRLGEYSELLYGVMKSAGYTLNWVLIDSPKAIGRREFMKRIACFNSGKEFSTPALIMLLRKTVKLLRTIDSWEQQIFFTAAYLNAPGNGIRLRRSTISKMDKAESYKDAENILKNAVHRLDGMKRSKKSDPVKLLVIGEIYTVIDSFANNNIEEILMHMGVSFQKGMSVSRWMDQVLLPQRIKDRFNHKYHPYMVGGYSHDTVREAADSGRAGFDGVVQLLPSGCMPEIVAEAPLGRLREDGVEILTLVIDENQSAEGYVTRLEAFVDMLKAKKHRS